MLFAKMSPDPDERISTLDIGILEQISWGLNSGQSASRIGEA